MSVIVAIAAGGYTLDKTLFFNQFMELATGV